MLDAYSLKRPFGKIFSYCVGHSQFTLLLQFEHSGGSEGFGNGLYGQRRDCGNRLVLIGQVSVGFMKNDCSVLRDQVDKK